MEEQTKVEYFRLADHFFKKYMKDQPLTPRGITEALIKNAAEFRPAYFTRLKRALVVHQEENGFTDSVKRLKEVKNPITSNPKNKSLIKPKQVRIKQVNEKDEKKLLAVLENDKVLLSALTLAKHSGARPAEFKNISIDDDNLITIIGAKKTARGDRGADRSFLLPDPEVASSVRMALATLAGSDEQIGQLQARLSSVARKLWPQRKAVPTLYSWRHQMGSDLKGSNMDRKEIAYIMGHQSTESVNRYGNRKTAQKDRGLPVVPKGTDLSKIRENHTSAPSVEQQAIKDPFSGTKSSDQSAKGMMMKEKLNDGRFKQVRQDVETGLGLG